MSAPCIFCDPRQFDGRLIVKRDGFLVVATKGQIVDGYSLVIPKRHVSCFGELEQEELECAEAVLARVRFACLMAYGRQPILFEHGLAGQSVKHAHMHAVPTDADLFPRLAADFPDHERLPSLQPLRETYRREGPYLYYERADGGRTLFHVFPRPQYLRVALADAVGHPERADWKKVDQAADEEMVAATVATLGKTLK